MGVHAQSIVAILVCQVLLMAPAESYSVSGGPLGDGLDLLYPGEKFDPLGFADDPDTFAELKIKEIKNGSLSQFAMLGMYASGIVVGKGPVECWASHIADPVTANGFAYATKYVPGLRARSTNPQQTQKHPKTHAAHCVAGRRNCRSTRRNRGLLRYGKRNCRSTRRNRGSLRCGEDTKIKNATRATNVRKTHTHRTRSKQGPGQRSARLTHARILTTKMEVTSSQNNTRACGLMR